MTDHPIEPVRPPEADGRRELEELRQLLLRHERMRLDGLEGRLDDAGVRADELAEVLAGALRRGAERDHEALTEALASPVAEAMQRSVRDDPKTLSDALFPVMGPAIRKAILETVRGMIESMNRAIEASLSWQGLRWRLEALRSGKSFAEVALLHSLVYRVEQLLLIHRETGLLLRQMVAPEVETQDADMVSGMLTAIRDFVHDSFGAGEGEALHIFRVGELQVLVEDSPTAVLAAVVRGEPPHELRIKLQEALERIVGRFARELRSFEGDAAPFEPADELLASCLLMKRAEQRRKRGPMVRVVWAIAIAAIAGLAAWWVHARIQEHRWRAAIAEVDAAPGLVVTGVTRRDGHRVVTGLRDPLADTPADVLAGLPVDPARAEWRLEPYQSLEDEIGTRRLRALLEPPPGVELRFEEGRLAVVGHAGLAWLNELRRRVETLGWVDRVDRSALRLDEEDELDELRTRLTGTSLLMELNSSEVLAESAERIALVAADLSRLHQLGAALGLPLEVTVVGHTDASGSEGRNDRLSELRAQAVAERLVENGVPAGFLQTRGVATLDYLEDPDPEVEARRNRRVTFAVQSPSR